MGTRIEFVLMIFTFCISLCFFSLYFFIFINIYITFCSTLHLRLVRLICKIITGDVDVTALYQSMCQLVKTMADYSSLLGE